MSDRSKAFPRQGWYLQAGKVEYGRSLAWQRSLVKMRREGLARDTILLVEHPPVITVGKDGHIENYENCDIPPVKIERGGDVTYHGPGQIVAYFIFNLTRRGRDVRLFMEQIQQGIIKLLAEFDLEGRMSEENTGVWVNDKKIASLGVAEKQWISFHGMALNINTDMREFRQINPCGLTADDMISLSKITGKKHRLKPLEARLIKYYSEIFETNFTPVELADLAEELESQEGSNVI
jgi:lipoyl(octanoyl) transferase